MLRLYQQNSCRFLQHFFFSYIRRLKSVTAHSYIAQRNHFKQVNPKSHNVKHSF